jgi:hypothetical protein
MRERLVAAAAELVHHRLGHAHVFVGGHGDPHVEDSE